MNQTIAAQRMSGPASIACLHSPDPQSSDPSCTQEQVRGMKVRGMGTDTGRNGNCAATSQRDSGCSRRYCVSVWAAPTASCGDQTGYSPDVREALSSCANSAVRNCMARYFSARGSSCSAGSSSASFMAPSDYRQPPGWQARATGHPLAHRSNFTTSTK